MLRRAIFILTTVYSAGISAQHGAVFHGLGGNEANQGADFSLANNPAAQQNTTVNGGIWLSNRFTGTNINQGGIAAAFRIKTFVLGTDATYSGTPEFNRNALHISASQKFTAGFSAGFSAGITSVSQGGPYPNQSAFSGRLGANLKINEKWEAACVLSNPWNKVDESTGVNPTAAGALGYQANKTTRLWGQYRYDSRFKPVYGVSVLNEINDKLHVFGALQTGYEPISAGLEWRLKNMRFAASTRYHVALGFSPMFSLFWNRK